VSGENLVTYFALPCTALPCPAVPCPALPCLALFSFLLLRNYISQLLMHYISDFISILTVTHQTIYVTDYRGMVIEYDDAESVSICSSNSRGVKRTSRSRKSSSASPRASSYKDVMHIDHAARLRLHLSQKEKEFKQGGIGMGTGTVRGTSSGYGDYTVQWCSGGCSKLGPRESNEDRLVALVDLADALSSSASSSFPSSSFASIPAVAAVATTAVLQAIAPWTGAGIGRDTRAAYDERGAGTGTHTGMSTGISTATANSGVGTPVLSPYRTRSVSDAYSSAPNTWRGVGSGTGTGAGTGAGTPAMSIFHTRSVSDVYSSAPNSSRGIHIHTHTESRTRRKLKDASKLRVKHGYFAVYDGHCGSQAATHLQDTLHASIFAHPLYHTDINAAITDVCVATDRHFLAHSRERMQYSGSTALGAIIRGNELVVFNIGDCQAVVCCDGAALDMNDPHKPNR
jgi:Protein phosphatase 2C